MDEWEKSSDDPKIREEYYDRRKAVLDEMAAVREAELRLREAIRQSKKEGREEGREEGKKEGREEVKKKVTKRLLEKGMDFKAISDITGMSEEEIKNLR
ncbi:hypothetical protein [Desulfosporosinus hippei]|nr:hypothetical protein [Desulfosporosinus hippei]